jgi:acetyltransferase-like isoleucine patch superfamily enzyme
MNTWRLFLADASEPLIRIVAWTGSLLASNRLAIEMRIRGAIIGGMSRRLRVGRGVLWIGNPKKITLGNNVSLYGNTHIDFSGERGQVLIGDRSHVDHYCVLYAQGGLTVGSDCAIASGVIIYSQTNHDAAHDGTPVARQPTTYAAVNIGDGAWLGCGARILPGVNIGKGAHIGAGSVVTKDVPPMVVAYGVPARTIRRREGNTSESA